MLALRSSERRSPAKELFKDFKRIDIAKRWETSGKRTFPTCALVYTSVAELVVSLFFIRVRQNLVRFVYFFKLFFSLRRFVFIRMPRKSQFAVGCFQLPIGCTFFNLQNFVIISVCCHKLRLLRYKYSRNQLYTKARVEANSLSRRVLVVVLCFSIFFKNMLKYRVKLTMAN